MSESASPTTAPPQTAKPSQKPTPKSSTKPKKLPPYNVILLNDDDHTYDYVLEMLKALFGYSFEKGYKLAREVDTDGRVILLTTTKEHAELKRDQIHAYGPDWRMPNCKGSMTAVLEPAAFHS